MYVSAINVGARQFQRDERVRVMCENQDDQQERLLKLAQRADDVDARYGSAFEMAERAAMRTRDVATRKELAALARMVHGQRWALGLIALLAAAEAVLMAVLR